MKIGPTFAHTGRMIRRDTAGIANQTIADVVPPFVRDDAVVQRSVPRDATDALQRRIDHDRYGELADDRRAIALRHRQRWNRNRRIRSA